jgi:hypothetical protein
VKDIPLLRSLLTKNSCWHQFMAQQAETRALNLDPKNEHVDGDRTEGDVEINV